MIIIIGDFESDNNLNYGEFWDWNDVRVLRQGRSQRPTATSSHKRDAINING